MPFKIGTPHKHPNGKIFSWLALYAVSLAQAGDCAVYPQGGGVKVHTRTEGVVTADVAGSGPFVRSAHFDGDNDEEDVVIAEIDPAKVDEARAKVPALCHDRPYDEPEGVALTARAG